MTVTELEAWATEKQAEWAKYFAIDVMHETPWAYMLQFIADWRAMRQFIMDHHSDGFVDASDLLPKLRLKP